VCRVLQFLASRVSFLSEELSVRTCAGLTGSPEAQRGAMPGVPPAVPGFPKQAHEQVDCYQDNLVVYPENY